MRSLERDAPRFYFALPRLAARVRGQNGGRTEKNWLEANVAGAAVMLVSYLGIAHYLLRGVAGWTQIAFLLPVLVVTFLFWLVVLYLDAQIIKLLRAAGILRTLSSVRAQSVLIGIVTTALAYGLLTAGPLLKSIGLIWIGAVCVNLLAALLLAFIGSHVTDGHAT